MKAILPLRTRMAMPLGTGTRHRSAVSITEATDAVAFVASEERGEISLAYRGDLVRVRSRAELLELTRTALKRKKIGKVAVPA